MTMKMKFILVIEKKTASRYYVCTMWLYHKIVENHCYVLKILKCLMKTFDKRRTL